MGQKATHEPRIFLTNPSNVPVEKLDKVGAEKTLVQYLLDDRHGSNRFALRLYTVQKGGHTPLDEHVHEHQVYVVSGKGLLRQSRDTNAPLEELKPGDSLFIPSNSIHQFSNIQDEPFVFLCVKGNPQLYADAPSRADSEPEPNYC